jgi:UrcA family protein
MKRFLAAAAIVALSLGVLQAAEAAGSSREEVVRYADLDPDSRADTKVLYARLRSAARGVCGPAISTRAESDRLIFEDCVDKSIIAAANTIDRDLLIEYVDERSR